MKIRLKIDPAITREALIERLPGIAKSIAEAVLEKSRGVEEHIEKSDGRVHPIAAVAQGESEIYSSGHDVLSGIHSWLLRSLKIETELSKSALAEDTYRDQVLEKYGVTLGNSVTLEQAREIDDVLETMPRKFVSEKLKKITTDERFGASKSRYPNHGRYIDEECKIILNPVIFGITTDYRDATGNAISKLAQTLVHEIGHGIDDHYGLSDKKEWQYISGWKYIGLDVEPPAGFERMHIKDEGRTVLKGRWAYRKGTNFPRWYGARNPKEDFCEAFAFAFLGCPSLFEGETGKKKLDFVNDVIGKLEKSIAPDSGLELAGDEDLVKSDGFSRYLETRRSSLPDRDPAEAEKIAKSEFLSELCEDLFLEKSETGKPGVPASGAQPQGSGSPSVIKGMQRPGHKYLYRKEGKDGKYRYFYKAPEGDHYHADEPLHDEGRHFAQFKNGAEWDAYGGQGIEKMADEGVVSKARKGEVSPSQYDDVAVPDLIHGIINPKAGSGDPNDSQEEVDGNSQNPNWRNERPEREDRDFLLTPSDSKEIETALKGWDIESVDPDWRSGGSGSLVFKVKIKNDGHALMKMESGHNLVQEENSGSLRAGIEERTTVHREAFAYAIDRALGWNLVPPTMFRPKVGGMDQNHIRIQMKKTFGSPIDGTLSQGETDALDGLVSGKESGASLQFFARGADTVGSEIGLTPGSLKDIDIKELVRASLFDMVINHQDRHDENVMIMDDDASDSRYGGAKRLVLVDNGHSFGNGTLFNRRFYDLVKPHVASQYPDKSTLSDLENLRDTIRRKNSRRDLASSDIRKNISHDQIERVAHRIDYILNNKDAKGRVKMPNWDELGKWELDKFPQKHAAIPNPYDNPFDVTGRTSILEKRDGAPPKFKNIGAVQDFIHPMLEHLNDRQKKMAKNICSDFEDSNTQYLDSVLMTFATNIPKGMMAKMFFKQKFHQRFGLPAHVVREMEDDLNYHGDRDLSSEFKGKVKEKNIEVYNKLERGELSREGLRKAVGETVFNQMDDLWLLPMGMRSSESKDKTEQIFDNPDGFSWGSGVPKRK